MLRWVVGSGREPAGTRCRASLAKARYASCSFIGEKFTAMIATLNAFDEHGVLSHSDTRYYPNLSLLWEHIGSQQNNRKTIRVHVQTDSGLEYEISFSSWTPARRYSPSRRFHTLLTGMGAEIGR